MEFVYIILDSDSEPVGKAYKYEGNAREAFVEYLESRLPAYGFGSWSYYSGMYGFGKSEEDIEDFKYAMTQYADYDDDFEDIARLVAIEVAE